MIDKELFFKIQKLLREGKLSQRRIAVLLGVSRSAVRNVNRKESESADTLQEIIPPGVEIRRSPDCGARVRMHCLACQLRAIREASPRYPEN